MTTKWMLTATVFVAMLSCSTSEISVQKDALRHIKTVAVLPFTVEKGIDEKAGRDSMEFFKSHVLSAGFRLVERQALDGILKEKELALSGLTANDSMELGRLLSADGLLEGRVTQYGEETRIVDLRLSAYGPDAYNPAKDPGDGTFFQKNGEWFRKAHMRIFKFQVFVRLFSARDGSVVFTLQNSYPESKFEVDQFNVPNGIEDYVNRVLQQMGKDLKKALTGK